MRLFLSAFFFCLVYGYPQEIPPPAAVLAAPKTLSDDEVGTLIRSAAAKHNLSPAFVKSIVAAESAFKSDAVSSRGAVGLMQVMPATALEMGLDPTIPEQNIEAGTKYLSVLVDRYRNTSRGWLKRVIAAYNAGPGNVDKYKGIPPFRETKAYVTRVLAFLRLYQRTG